MYSLQYLKLQWKERSAIFNGQLTRLVQAKYFLHTSSLMEYKKDKMKGKISETSQMLQSYDQVFCCLQKANSVLLLFIPLLMFLLWDFV